MGHTGGSREDTSEGSKPRSSRQLVGYYKSLDEKRAWPNEESRGKSCEETPDSRNTYKYLSVAMMVKKESELRFKLKSLKVEKVSNISRKKNNREQYYFS